MSMEFYGEFLPEATTWFRLPEYVKAILEPKLDNDAVELFGYNSEGTPVKIERSQLGGSESVTVNSTAEQIKFLQYLIVVTYLTAYLYLYQDTQ